MDNLIEFLWKNSVHKGNSLAYRYLETGEVAGPRLEITWLELANKVKATAALLQTQAQVGDRALLLYGPGLDFIVAICACFASGVIAVPSYPPKINRINQTLPRLQSIILDAGVKLVLTSSKLLKVTEPICSEVDELKQLRWIATNEVATTPNDWKEFSAKSEDVAYLQYTSGSTGDPKGVMVAHSNLLASCLNFLEYSSHNPEAHYVSWLPSFHDMGLIWGLMTPLVGAIPCTFMPPAAFLQKPSRWLEAISHFRGTSTASPNFGYDLCVRKVDEETLAKLDLSCLEATANAAEPVRAETVVKFQERFGPVGFHPTAMCPSFGLAENTLQVTVKPPITGQVNVLKLSKKALEQNQALLTTNDDSVEIVGCGPITDVCNVTVVDPETFTQVPNGGVGEIWLSGPLVTKGYWGRPELSKEIFQASIEGDSRNWLRTGDFGFIHNNELFITGRLKDLIIIRGRNIYPQDIERAIEAVHPAILPSCVAAFAVGKNGDADGVAVVAELVVKSLGNSSIEDLLAALRLAILNEFEVSLDSILLIERGSIHKTTSGKIQRRACRNSFLKETFPQIALWTMQSHLTSLTNSNSNKNHSPSNTLASTKRKIFREELEVLPEKQRFSAFLSSITMEITEVLSLPTTFSLPPDMPLKELGFDSLKAAEVSNRLSTMVETELPASLLFDYPTAQSLAKYLFNNYFYPTPAPAFDSSMFSDEQIKDLISAIPVASLRQTHLLEQLIKLSQNELTIKPSSKNGQNNQKQKIKWTEMDIEGVLREFNISV